MRHLEGEEQEALFQWAAMTEAKHPLLRLLFHVPNGGKRNKAEAARLKRQGVKSGVPDLFLPVPRGGYHGLWIEMKAGKNKPTANQEQWIENLKRQDYCVHVCCSWEAAADVIHTYLTGKIWLEDF